MDPALIIAGIRAITRLYQAGADSYSQYVRDKAVLAPTLNLPPFDDVDVIRDVLLEADQIWRITASGPLTQYWDVNTNGPDPNVAGSQEALYIAAVQIRAERDAAAAQLLPERGREIAGELLLEQWAQGQGPVGPVSRFALTLADVACEFIGANPSLLGVGGNGEKLIAAIATNLTEMIPDDAAEFGPKSQFAERVLGIFLRAGLETLQRHADTLIGKQHLQQLVKNALPPIVQALPADLSEQSRWRDVTEALLGPAASAAIGTIAANPRSFLGGEFDPNNTLGALTRALLTQTSQLGLREQFTEEGCIALYRAALSVAADRPELFVGEGDRASESIARDLFSHVAATLRDAPPPFDRQLGIELTTTVLETIRVHGTRFLSFDEPWERGVAALASQIISGLEAGLRDSGSVRLQAVFSGPQLVDLARVFAREAARTPGLISGDHRELEPIIRSVAQAIAADPRRLLAPEDWLAIAATVAREALANPQRLFRTTDGSLGEIGSALIQDLLAVANAEHAAGGRADGGVLFGSTLREVLVIAIESAAGNPAAAATHRAAIKTLAEELSQVVRAQAQRLGSREWLYLFRSLLGPVLNGLAVEVTDARIDEILSGGEIA